MSNSWIEFVGRKLKLVANADGSFGIAVVPSSVVKAPAITVTAGAYHAGDNIGGILTLSDVASEAGRSTTLARITILDAANQKPQLEVLFFNANPADSTFTNNAAPVIHANDEAKYCGSMTVYASDYLTVGAKAVACVAPANLRMVPSGTDLYAVLLTPSTPIYVATTDLKIGFAFDPD